MTARTGRTVRCLNNAISGIDQALWDIKGRQAGMPVYSACGRQVPRGSRHLCTCEWGRVRRCGRECAALYGAGLRNVRVQVGLPGMAGYGSRHLEAGRPQALHDKPLFDREMQMRRGLKLLEICRHELGDEVSCCTTCMSG